LIFIAGFQDIGPDYLNYKRIYNNGNLFNNFEFGFAFAGNIFKTMNLHFNVFLIFMVFLSVYLKYKFFSSFTENLFFIFLFYYSLFYFIQDFAQIKQAVAIGFVLISSKFAMKNNFIKFVIFLFLAISFHF
jgi:hypothetical protein